MTKIRLNITIETLIKLDDNLDDGCGLSKLHLKTGISYSRVHKIMKHLQSLNIVKLKKVGRNIIISQDINYKYMADFISLMRQ